MSYLSSSIQHWADLMPKPQAISIQSPFIVSLNNSCIEDDFCYLQMLKVDARSWPVSKYWQCKFFIKSSQTPGYCSVDHTLLHIPHCFPLIPELQIVFPCTYMYWSTVSTKKKSHCKLERIFSAALHWPGCLSVSTQLPALCASKPDRCFPFCVILLSSIALTPQPGPTPAQQVNPCHPMPTMRQQGKYNTEFGALELI